MTAPVEVELLADGRLVVWSTEDSRNLFNTDFYGKPLGNPKPREDFEEPLILDLIEGIYLLEKKKVFVLLNNHKMTFASLRKVAREKLEGFDAKYRVYHDLREKGFVVTPGLKYGCDFAVYEHGPGIDHAPYIIQVMSREDQMTALDVVKAGRLASTVRKTFIAAIPSCNDVEYLEFKWWKA
ncbi:MAG: tRNA-intron lyase [Candidatus Bathyarchaeia archaeon]